MTWGRNLGLGQSLAQYLALIAQYESGNQNIPNYKYGPGFTAQGYYQITNSNWLSIAPQLGIDTSLYPNAMSAPQSVQAQVASYLLTSTPAGVANWSNYNPQLLSALNSAGLQTSGPVTAASSAAAGAGDGPIVDISGAAAATPTPDILSQLDSAVAGAGIDLTDPLTEVAIAVAIGAAAFLAFA